jgi:hypothetical protein
MNSRVVGHQHREIVDGRSAPVVIGSMRTILLGWGMTTLCLYMASFLLPLAWTGVIRMFFLLSSVTFSFYAYSLTKYSLRLCFPVVMLLVMQLWSIFTMIHGWIALGRPTYLGRAEFWMLEVILPFFVSACMVYIEPKARDWILKLFLIGFGLSCVFAALQFFRVPPFFQIANQFYAQKDMDFWDGKPGLRAVGLTSHPALLAIQALVCFGIVASRLTNRKWTTWEMAGLFFFSAIVMFSQARMLYIVLIAVWIVTGIMMLRHSFFGTLKIAAIGTALLICGIMAAPTRLGYGLMSTSFQADDSYQYRAERRWSQADQIYQKFPITGIGPSSILFLGDGIPDRYTQNMALMESGYRAFLAMYGFPGLLMLMGGLLTAMILCIMVMANKRESPQRREMGFLGLLLVLIVTLNSYSANTFDQYLTVPTCFILCGVLLRTRKEEADYGRPTNRLAVVEPVTEPEPAEPMAKLKALLRS